MTTITLTPQEERVLAAIRTFWEQHGYAPTIRELAEMSGFQSSSAIHRWLGSLSTKGVVLSQDFQPRTIRINPDVLITLWRDRFSGGERLAVSR